MKLTCDLCGSDLQMNANGQSAKCINCGLEYPKERLMEMLNNNTTVKTETIEVREKPQMRNLFLKRKFSLNGCAAKAVVYLDGEECAVLGARGETCVPISQGEHEITVLMLAGSVVMQRLENLAFQVKDRDVYGLLYVKTTAFTGSYVFEVGEV